MEETRKEHERAHLVGLDGNKYYSLRELVQADARYRRGGHTEINPPIGVQIDPFYSGVNISSDRVSISSHADLGTEVEPGHNVFVDGGKYNMPIESIRRDIPDVRSPGQIFYKPESEDPK